MFMTVCATFNGCLQLVTESTCHIVVVSLSLRATCFLCGKGPYCVEVRPADDLSTKSVSGCVRE
jgi:hypothetical protein